MQTWIRTNTGKKFFPLAPTVDMVDIEDIAHALSHQCRFSGHTSKFYSVAQHSVHVAQLLEETHNDKAMALAGLLHDASEAYLVDVPSPVKKVMPTYRDAEELVMAAIMQTFGLKAFDEEIKHMDQIALLTEARDLMGSPGWILIPGITADDRTIEPWSSEKAKYIFLSRFHHLTDGRFAK